MKPIQKLATNQFYFFQGNDVVFQSYDTIVCVIENYQTTAIVKVTQGQPQSKTTAKYLNQFLSKFSLISNYKKL